MDADQMRMSMLRPVRLSLATLTCFMALALLAPPPSRVEAGELRTLRSAHYLIYTDLEQALAEELAQRLDAMYDEYARRLVEFNVVDPRQKFEVYLFAKREDFMRMTQNRYVNAGGVFMSGRNLLAGFLEGQGRDGLRRIIQHEAFHQFAYTAISQDIPVWLNEGMAQYFEEGIWTGTHFTFGHVPPRRLRQLQHDRSKKQLVPFRTMLSMTDDEWEKGLIGDANRGATQYNQAWAMIHFLVHGANGQDRYRPRLIDMLKRIHAGTPAPEAFVQAFSRNIDGFQARFEEFAAELEATPEATLIERQGVLADLLSESARIGRRYDNVRAFREAVTEAGARIKYTKGQIRWETALDVNVYFSDLGNRLFEPNELYFDRRGTAPLPDLVCRGTDDLRLRTRFYNVGERIEHEVLCELPTR
jgi:hypothetical protein